MLKTIGKYLDLPAIKLTIVISLLYNIFFNTVIFLHRFDYYKATIFKAFLEIGKDFAYSYIVLFICFFSFTINKSLFWVTGIFLFLTGAIVSYYLFFFKISPTPEIIAAFFDTNFIEVYEIVSSRLIIWLIFSLFICCYTIKIFKISEVKSFIHKLLAAFCLFITLNCIIVPPYRILKVYFPIQYLHNGYQFLFKNFIKTTNQPKIDISKQFTFKDNSPEDVIGVLVIGESARYDHFGLNGYHRNTTPLLSNIENIFTFKANACANLTYISVPCLLSRQIIDNTVNHATGEELLDQLIYETTFLSVLKHLGFNTHWLGTQSLSRSLYNRYLGGVYDEVDFAIIPGGSTLFTPNAHDEVLLPYLQDLIVSNHDRTPLPRHFIVLHTSGSHWDYDKRYPKKFQQFLPICNAAKNKLDASGCSIESLTNSYDNSILYTDFFLREVIKLLENHNSFVIYISDHGESLGENGRYGHGGDIQSEQIEIPVIVWISQKFSDNHPSLLRTLNNKQEVTISHNHIFHTVLDCLGIESDIINKNLSMCNKLLLN